MRTSSAKAKGQRLSKEIKEVILSTFPQLQQEDVNVVPSGVKGMDIWLSPIAQKLFPFAVEAKNQENARPWEWIKQAESNQKENLKPIVVFKRNREEPYIIISLKNFMEIVR